MKKKKEKKERAYIFPFKLCRGFFGYLISLVFALIFTQALRNPASAVLFIFLLILPGFELIYVLSALLFVRFGIQSEHESCRREEHIKLRITKRNRFLLPYPFVTLHLKLFDGVSEGTYRVRTSLSPLEKNGFFHSLHMRLRGTYTVGIDNAYVTSLLGFFRIMVGIKRYTELKVYPRQITVDTVKASAEGIGASPIKVSDGDDMSGVRDYTPGDTLRSVHWKLSAKAQGLLVRQYEAQLEEGTLVVADLRKPYTSHEASALMTDRIVEVLLAICTELYKNGRSFSVPLGTEPIEADPSCDMEKIKELISFAPMAEHGDALYCDTSSTYTSIYITPDIHHTLASLPSGYLPDMLFIVSNDGEELNAEHLQTVEQLQADGVDIVYCY